MRNNLQIDLWFWRLDASPADVARWRGHLDDAELERMARFASDDHKARFVVCRSRMRRILGWYTQRSPRDIVFATTGRDKPVLAGANATQVTFNLTHTDGLACLAVTHGVAVGVDLECVRDMKDDFIAYTLNQAEHARVLALSQAARQQAFFRYWTAKEAYLKAIGTGLWQSLKSFDVEVPLSSSTGEFAVCGLPRIDDTAERARDWHLYTFAASDQHIGALAVVPPEGRAVEVRTRWLPGATAPDTAGRA